MQLEQAECLKHDKETALAALRLHTAPLIIRTINDTPNTTVPSSNIVNLRSRKSKRTPVPWHETLIIIIEHTKI
jgi:hypothetical protein